MALLDYKEDLTGDGMNKVIMFSDMFLPTFPFLELPLYHELVRLGASVTYVLQDGDVRLTTPHLRAVFEKLNLKTVKKPEYISSSEISKKGDVVLMRFAYKGAGGTAGEWSRKSGRTVFMYDPSGIDMRVRQCPAHYTAVKSKDMKMSVLKKFPRAYKNIFTTGTIHYDAAAITEVDRKAFMESYGLDPGKKFAILTPANPGELGHQHGVNNEYTEIIRIVRELCPDYEIVVKAHPLDYTASMKAQPGIVHKNEHYAGKHSWESFAPGIKVIRAEEGYEAIRACDVVLNVRSSIAMETCLFPKPLVNINRQKYTTNWPHDPSVMVDVEMGELATVLNSEVYTAVLNPEVCKAYAKKHCYSDDGKAYERIANAVMKVLRGEV